LENSKAGQGLFWSRDFRSLPVKHAQ
jgi:hypothetical protein